MATAKTPNVTEAMATTMTMRLPPEIGLDTPLTGSVLSLPPECRIHHKTFVPVELDGLQACHVVELARRDIHARRKMPALSGILGIVHISKEGIALHVFAVSGEGYDVDVLQELENLEYAGLHTAGDISFATNRCLGLEDDVSMEPQNRSVPHRASLLLPRLPLRTPLSLFLAALRTLLLVDIIGSSHGVGRTQLLPFKSGFLYGSRACGTSRSSLRSASYLQYCHLHLDFSPTHIYVQPLIRPSRHLPLPHDPSRPGPIITPGKSLTLLPKGISAYLIANYTGPTATLEEDFKACLPGLVPDAPDSSPNQSSFVIVWIEMVDDGPRGLICIWPRLLCMVTTTLPDRHVSTLPDLPPELRPYASISSSCENASSSGTPICPINRRRNLRKHRPMKPTPRQGHCQNSIDVRRNGLSNTSLNVNIYISALVKHRDAERERLKRERDIATGAKKDASNTKEAASHTRNESPPIKVERDAPPPAPPPLNTRTNPLAIDTKDLGTSSQRVQSTSPPVAEDASLFSDDDDDGDASPPPPPTLPDSLSNLDMSWPPDPTSNGNFLPMNSETDFGMSNAESLSHLGIGNIQFPMISSAHNTDNNQHMMDLDFANNLGAFTDADFSFFDAPGTSTQFLPIQPPAPTAEMFISATGLTPSAGPVPFGLSPPTFYDHQQTNEQISTPWTGHLLSPSLAPSGAAMAVDEVATTPSSAPTILPSMPPTVASSPVVKLRADTASPSASSTLVMFDAIPFAASHLNVDDKYTSGKFSVSYDSRVGTSVSVLKGWREVYNNATDPHVGIAKKIAQHRIGVPSKSPAGNARTAQWVKDHDYEAWEPLAAGADVDEEMPSPDDSDDETLTSAEVLSFPPGNLPLGSILLAAHFLPGLLLPMTIPSPPTASGAPSPAGVPGATPAGVPTPLSPTTLQGAETEKLRNLEAAAQVLASEFVSNRQWMEAWVAAQDGNSGQNSMIATDTHDINLVNDALRGCKSLQNRLFVRSLLEDDTHDNAMDSGSLDIMTSPSVYVSQSAAILKVQPSAVRFWEKLGLHPRGGHKNVTALVFYDQRSIPTEAVDAWSAGITAAYEARHFGHHTRGHAAEGSEHGLVSIRFDSFRKELDQFLRIVPPAGESLLFYIIVPPSIASLHSQHLRQVLGVMKRAYRTGVPILFHLVPEVQVLQCGVSGINDTRRSILTITACDVYDRLPVMAQRRPPRTTTGSIPQLLLSAPRFLAPAYSLARREHITYKFTPNSTWIDAIDRCMLLHVGYAITSDGRWTIATCVDELGEASDISVWLTQPDNGYAHLVARVWSFVHEFAQKANIEWRIIIQKWGSMEEDELDAWTSHLQMGLTDMRPAYVGIFAINSSFHWTMLPPQQSLNVDDFSSKFPRYYSDSNPPHWKDLSAVSSVLSVKPRPLISLSNIDNQEGHTLFHDVEQRSVGLLPLSSYILLRVPYSTSRSHAHMMSVDFLYSTRSASSTFDGSIDSVHTDVMKSLNDLTVLHATRHPVDSQQHQLPLHLYGLEVVERALTSME